MARQQVRPAAGTRTLGLEEVPQSRARSRPWWRRPMLIGVLGLLVLGLVIMQLPGKKQAVGQQPQAVATTPGGDATTVPTGTQGTGAVSLGQRTVDGVPVGYLQSQAGAVAAAVNDELARSSADYFTSTAVRHRILKTIMTSQALAGQTAADDQAISTLDDSIGAGPDTPLIARAAALGTRVDSYSPQSAIVEVWLSGIVGMANDQAPVPVTASWDTYTITLAWQDSDWHVATITSVSGPTPLQTSQNPTSVDQFASVNGEFDAPPYVG